MSYNETIAVIGATSEAGRMVIAHLVHVPYRLLLMDGATEQLATLQQTLLSIGTKAEIDMLQCCREASWEADLILITSAQPTIEDTARKIKEVATTKIVVNLGGDLHAFELLQQLLPHSKLVQVELNCGNNAKIRRGDKAVADTVTQLFELAGFNVQREDSTNN